MYAREDQALVYLAAHVAELREPGQSAGLPQIPDRDRLAEYLSRHEVTIVCGLQGWTLETDSAVVAEGLPPRMMRVTPGRSPQVAEKQKRRP